MQNKSEEVKVLMSPGITMTYDPKNPPNMQVYKCPYLNCPKFFREYANLIKHRIEDHAEMPKSITSGAPVGKANSYFSKEHIGKNSALALRQKVRTYILIMKLYLMPLKKETQSANETEKGGKHGKENKKAT